MGYARLLRQRSCRDAPSRSPRETGCVVRARLLPEPGLYAEPRQLPHRAVSAHDAMPPERPVDPDRKSVVEGKSGSVPGDLGGGRIIKKKNRLDTINKVQDNS